VGSAAVRTSWASGSGDSSPSGFAPLALNALGGPGGEITPVPVGGYSGGGSGGTGFSGGSFSGGSYGSTGYGGVVGGLPPGTLRAGPKRS